MAKVLHCDDVVPGCDAQVRAETAEEVLRQAAAHARDAHGLAELDDGTAAAVRASIRDA